MAPLGWLIAFLLLVIAVAEFVGIARSDRAEADTITEVYRLLRDALPVPFRYLLMFLVSGLLFWTILHFWDLA
jgi:hypothetical protein